MPSLQYHRLNFSAGLTFEIAKQGLAKKSILSTAVPAAAAAAITVTRHESLVANLELFWVCRVQRTFLDVC